MTTTQSLELFQLVQRHFNNADDATSFVTEIEAVVDNRMDAKSEMLASKADLKEEIGVLRVEMKD